MPSAAYSEGEFVIPREIHGGRDIFRYKAANRQSRLDRHPASPVAAGRGVELVSRQQRLTTEARSKPSRRRPIDRSNGLRGLRRRVSISPENKRRHCRQGGPGDRASFQELTSIDSDSQEHFQFCR